MILLALLALEPYCYFVFYVAIVMPYVLFVYNTKLVYNLVNLNCNLSWIVRPIY